jgi:uncharacterized membrane protein HdeD (DUF308 family)
MTTDQLWNVFARLLGVYFIVEGALYLPNAVVMSAMGLPEGTSRSPLVVAPLVQGAISIVAGALLLTLTGRTPSPAPPTIDVQDGLAVALQLLGVFFVVGGISTAARPAVDMVYSGTEWQFRFGEFGPAAVGVAAGILLAMRPRLVSLRLQAFRESRP